MKKDLLAVLIAVFLVVVIVCGTKIQSVDDYYLTHIDDIKEDSETVFITIDCSTVLNNWDDLDDALKQEKYVPADGKILARTEYVLRPGDTAFDILSRAARYNRIPLESVRSAAFDSVYVQGINQLYEFSCGELSGWMYRVNGQFPSYGSSKHKLSDGDELEWVYSCDLCRDVCNIWGTENNPNR